VPLAFVDAFTAMLGLRQGEGPILEPHEERRGQSFIGTKFDYSRSAPAVV
jgi:hypothetical protein